MIPKKQMDDKQLNFSQPLLSVRRGSFTNSRSEVINTQKTSSCPSNLPPLPFYKRELNSGAVGIPGVVPFQWERSPGKPKNESKKEQRETSDKFLIAPRLPPGRVLIYSTQKSTNKVLIDSRGSSSRSLANSLAEELEKEKENDNVSSSEDENMTYVDARDSLSRSESFFLDCSLNGANGLDDSNVKPYFSDHETRDFMMDRFLPAAEAVASGAPQFASKKHREEPKVIEPLTTGVKSKESPIYYDVHNISLRNIYGEEDQDDEEKEEEDEYEGAAEFSAKFCGLLPKFCVLNPISGLGGRAQIIPKVRSARTNTEKTGNHPGEVKNISVRNGYPNKSSSNGEFGRKCIAQSLGRDRRKTDLQKEGFTRFKELMEEHYAAEGITSQSNPITRRTLYIDSEQRASESQISNSSSSESRGRTPSVDYSLQDLGLVVHLPKEKSSPLIELPPPLPKSPSESWLSRTLPTISSKNVTSKTYLGNRGFKHGKTLSADLSPIYDR